eukprot:Selendium_serpulae@DN6937_c0_g1_i1.p3
MRACPKVACRCVGLMSMTVVIAASLGRVVNQLVPMLRPTTMSTLCNGVPSICDLPANDVMYAVAHKAHSARDSAVPDDFHHFEVLEAALGAGYRGLGFDVCLCADGAVQFCPSVCGAEGTRDAAEVLTNV